MSQKKNEGILFPTEIRVVGSYTDRLLRTEIDQCTMKFMNFMSIANFYDIKSSNVRTKLSKC